MNIIANNVRKKIRDEVGDAKFCILFDEAIDEACKEQIAIVLRFVHSDGFVECFYDIMHVKEITVLNLKLKYVELLLSKIYELKIFEVKNMMVLVT